MTMWQLQNKTPYQVLIFPFRWPDSQLRESLLVKGSFHYDEEGRCEQATQQSGLIYTDEYWEPGKSIRLGTDIIPFKPATDLIITADAQVAAGYETQRLQVGLEIPHRLLKTIQLVGPRHWQYGLLTGWQASEPQTFTRLPIRWDLAWGGTDPDTGARFDNNPWGCGFLAPGSRADVATLEVPCVEHYGAPITRLRKTYLAAGLSFVSADMAPRCHFLGSYDEQWQQETSPHLAQDFDFRFFQQAPADQILTPYLCQESISLSNMAPRPQQTIALGSVNPPKLRLQQLELSLNLDTVHIVANEQRLELCWRLVLPEQSGELTLYL